MIDNPYIEKLPFQFDIDQLQKHLLENVITLGDPIIQGGAYGGSFGGWSVLAAVSYTHLTLPTSG